VVSYFTGFENALDSDEASRPLPLKFPIRVVMRFRSAISTIDGSKSSRTA
jgi:hypothetical protein